MSVKVSVYMATSVDGFIARSNGDLDWLDDSNAMVPLGEDCGFGEFLSTVDTLLMGRKTYEKVLSFGEWPYGDTPVVVLSRNPISFPGHLPSTVSHTSEQPPELLNRLAGEGIKHVYVDGGQTIQGFLSEGLVDEITMTVIPVILGAGIPLFAPVKNDIHLAHIRTTTFDFGFVQSTYSVRKE